jgi:putative two-component system hydrogenase maturation factor HypX/HoxX
MRILLLCHSFNSLTQRLHVDLREADHEVSVEFDINDAVTREAVSLFRPDVVVASFLRKAIPEDVWRRVTCLVVHPGIRGDRGPSALDWAILEGAPRWGVTVIEAVGELDAGPVWAWREFPMRKATKSSLYRHEVTRAAVTCVFEALERFAHGEGPCRDTAMVRARPPCRRADRAIDWSMTTAEILARIRSADGAPGAPARLLGRDVLVFDAYEARGVVSVAPGDVLARSGAALLVATGDGAVWVGHVRTPGPKQIKQRATRLFADAAAQLPEQPGYPAIVCEQDGEVAYLHFPVHNGALATANCLALTETWKQVLQGSARVVVLMGGSDYWSNGLHLGAIEAADSPADESWANITAIDDFVRDVILTTDRIIVAAIRGNAGAGGVFLALAADIVWMRSGVVLNPHYKDMGNLHGSEYWTYLLPRRTGATNAHRIADARLPMGVLEAMRLGLVDAALPEDPQEADDAIRRMAIDLAARTDFPHLLADKRARRAADELSRPLQEYRDEELAHMRRNFRGFDPSYHVARYNFIHKVPKSRTPLTLARHRVHRPAAIGGAP